MGERGAVFGAQPESQMDVGLWVRIGENKYLQGKRDAGGQRR